MLDFSGFFQAVESAANQKNSAYAVDFLIALL
jgi:hypothetical protein